MSTRATPAPYREISGAGGKPDYTELIEEAPAGYVSIDPTGCIEHINQTGAAILGWEPSHMIGELFSRWIVQADRPTLSGLQQRLQASAAPETQSLRAKDRQGRIVNLRLECRRISPDLDREAGWRAILIDVSREQLSARKLRHLQMQLEQLGRLNAAGEMATSLAHELNQPLGAILLHCESTLRMLHSGQASVTELCEAVSQTREAALFASGIIRRLRGFLRNVDEPRAPCELGALIQDVAKLIEIDVRDNDIDLQLDVEPELPLVSVDKVQIEQVLLNLLRNGIESISERGSDAQRHIGVRAVLESPDQVKVAIEDAGVGLNPKHVQRIFKPFYTTKREGMGMGLSISRSIIEAHGGRIWAEAVRTQGAVFHFTLPVDRSAA